MQCSQCREIFAHLNERDTLVLWGIGQGKSNAEIGAALGYAKKTIVNLLTGLYWVLGVKTRAQAIAFLHEHEFMPLSKEHQR